MATPTPNHVDSGEAHLKRVEQEHTDHIRREVERHNADMADTLARTVATEAATKREDERQKIKLAQSADTHEKAMMLLAGLVPVLSTLAEFGQVARISVQYSKPEAIKASACELFVQAAKAKGDPKDLEAVAERLLLIAGMKAGNVVHAKGNNVSEARVKEMAAYEENDAETRDAAGMHPK